MIVWEMSLKNSLQINAIFCTIFEVIFIRLINLGNIYNCCRSLFGSGDWIFVQASRFFLIKISSN